MAEMWLYSEVRVTGERPVDMVPIRQLTSTEGERVGRALNLIGRMHGNRLIKPLLDATNSLGAVTNRVLWGARGSTQDVELRQQWSIELDSWLSHLAMFRRRVERETLRAVGQGLHDFTRAKFRDLHASDPKFRFAWEWRNMAQHGDDPLELSRIAVNRGPDGLPEHRWCVSAEVASSLPDLNRPILADLIATEPPCWEIIKGATESCSEALMSVFLEREDTLVTEAKWIFDLVGEGMRGLSERSNSGRSYGPNHEAGFVVVEGAILSGSWVRHVLQYDQAAYVLLSVDAARESAGLPRVHTPPSADLQNSGRATGE